MDVKDNHINYVEFKAIDLEQIKRFYTLVFGWSFTDYGPDYTAFSNSGLQGGFERAENVTLQGALIILYHSELESIQSKIEAAGGTITEPIFSFPGGRRFHFADPEGNVLAIWSDK